MQEKLDSDLDEPRNFSSNSLLVWRDWVARLEIFSRVRLCTAIIGNTRLIGFQEKVIKVFDGKGLMKKFFPRGYPPDRN